MSLTGMVAVVTGGAGGIGGATVEALIAQGARVAVLDREMTGATAIERLDVRCDVQRQEDVDAAVAATVQRWGRLDIVVNNAGIGAVGDVTAQDEGAWARVLDVNVIAIARTMRSALPHLQRSPAASVVNLCSAVAHVGVRQRALYSASKGAVHALTMAMAADHVADGIRVNAVSPGTTDTPWVGRLLAQADDPAEASKALRTRQPLGRLVSAQEVAAAVAFLASPAAGATTGTVLRVDGGMTALRL